VKIEAGKSLGEALERRGLYAFGTIENVAHVPEVKPRHIVI
jgi:hypothetical protein